MPPDDCCITALFLPTWLSTAFKTYAAYGICYPSGWTSIFCYFLAYYLLFDSSFIALILRSSLTMTIFSRRSWLLSRSSYSSSLRISSLLRSISAFSSSRLSHLPSYCVSSALSLAKWIYQAELSFICWTKKWCLSLPFILSTSSFLPGYWRFSAFLSLYTLLCLTSLSSVLA